MLKHIVFMKLKPEAAEADIAGLKKELGGLPAVIPEIKAFEFGQDILHTERSWDFALVSVFDDLEAMKRYQVHPDHQVVLKKVRAMCESIAVVDFEC
ncbi:MAG: Dabb family protein [Deltaproteobacteria bacterium]|nr:Dabb family protein [Deltaproteobacteria bacterium]